MSTAEYNEQFKNSIKNLAELCDLPRQSVCFQIMTLLNLFTRGQDRGEAERFESDDGQIYFDSNSIRQCMANHKTISNIHKGFSVLENAGFIERLVIDKNGKPIQTATFKRNSVMIYYRMTEKGLTLFGNV
ncbi:hypothetical protein GCM10007938_42320 [Vibrio zhanjiangensis]|uniref:MarR family transcriptional regulator n=1 Tax=Vibrio zhanjiangensis TaxID=1046128 RepID=A0ABQ6F5B4_9VIBR|nr:hypothetical protein [Vibrio zhanjiangensis]GLT20447.1 hypothetical protein GCM10007938_42320 [Vibrio zhanjiangensis]